MKLALPTPLLDLHPPSSDFHADFIAGLQATPKCLPCKYFYDAAGSALFEEICELPEYYPTRAETEILRENAQEIAGLIGPDACVLEPGSGSTRKVRLLLDWLESPSTYVPVEISRSALLAAAAELRADYPRLDVLPVCADYTRYLRLPAHCLGCGGNTVAFFPGSTIGNFEPAAARRFLARLAHVCGSRGLLLIGVDLRKDPAVIEAAYNDSRGVTACFNKNILLRANREIAGHFDPETFDHRAVYQVRPGRVEMQLVSRCDQSVRVNGGDVHFAGNETIITEHSYKYTVEGFHEIAAAAGYVPLRVWTDARQLFSVHLLRFGKP